MEEPSPETFPETKCQTRLTIVGGRVHDFVYGWIYKPYRLIEIKEIVPVEELSSYHFVPTKEIKELEISPGKELSKETRERWEKLISDYGEKPDNW